MMGHITARKLNDPTMELTNAPDDQQNVQRSTSNVQRRTPLLPAYPGCPTSPESAFEKSEIEGNAIKACNSSRRRSTPGTATTRNSRILRCPTSKLNVERWTLSVQSLRTSNFCPTSLCLALLLTILPLVSLAKEVPYLGGRVNDLAGMIDDGPQAQLETTLEQLETDTGSQLVILTVPNLEGAVLEDYALEVASTWQLGREGIDDGVLVLVAKEERRIRIEVGYGLEGAIPDVTAKRIIDGIMTPRFREGDFTGGITEATGALTGLIRGEAVELPEPSQASGNQPLVAKIVTALIFFVVIGTFSITAIFGKGGQSWFLYLFLMPFYGAFPIAFMGKYGLILLAGWIIGFPILRTITWHSGWGRSFRSTHPGWTTFASSGGGFSGGGSSFGGGFSGGGGSFGGGGASGGW